jgi:aryl-alcohol dehydrogenase-like predicted oxidoreductase
MGTEITITRTSAERSPNILLIPGTSSLAHLRENLQSALLQIPPEVIADLDAIGTSPTR